MARPKGTKNIETPERFWELFQEYAEQTKANPRYKHELDKFGNVVAVPLRVPLTIEGFEMYCFNQGVINDLSNYFANSNNLYADYSTICTRVRKAVRNDQIEGGMVGQYNTSITQRLNNLVEKTQTEIVEMPLFPDVKN
jgi:hypothetical protein